MRHSTGGLRKKRILIVNCYFDPLRIPVKRKFKIPQTMAPAYLAGVFSSQHCVIKLYDEVYSGPLEDEKLLSFPDMLVLTGLNVAFDRMLHITAYVKTKNNKAVVVAGGPAIRSLYRYAQQFFDFCCRGDLEELAAVVETEFGPTYLSTTYRERNWIVPRYDLAYWMKLIRYAESSRYCYFRCNYCSVTAENGSYQPYDLAYVRNQIVHLGRKSLIHFLDNNFASNNRRFTLARFALLKELHDSGYICKWGAEVTCDFFLEDQNLELAVESGCGGLFCGVESFDQATLTNFRKQQNTCMPQVELIQKSLQANIPFHYGLVFDLTTRTIDDLAAEWDFILRTPEIPLPSFVTLAIPLMKTPMFNECLANDRFLPNLRLRDLDGSTITLKPRNKLSEAVRFLERVKNLNGDKLKIIKRIKQFYRIYQNRLPIRNIALSQYGAFLLSAPKLSTLQINPNNGWPNPFKRDPRTFIGANAPLDTVYRPAFPIAPPYRHYFEPTPFTDSEGKICEALLPDLWPS